MFKSLTFLLSVALAAVVLAGCALPPPIVMPQAGGDPLAGTSWLLTGLNGAPPLAGTAVTLEFSQDGRLGGSDGCNNYSTSYSASGNAISLSGPMMSTMMACPEPIMQQATAYQQAVASATTFQMTGNTLTLYDAGGNAVASFSAQSQDIAGTAWTAISYNNGRGGVVSLIIDTEITAEFSTDGMVSGSGGCNNYSGAYTAETGSISIGPLASTMMMCAEDVTNQETEYLAALQSAATYSISAGKLEMRTAEGAIAVIFQQP